MTSRRSILGPFLSAALTLFVAGCSSEPIPLDDSPLGSKLPVDERLEVPGLTGPVDAVRDVDGRYHIYATTMADAMRVEGYLVARDRHVQLDFLRRLASGRIAELLGGLDASLVEGDIAFRHIGLRRVAEAQWATADGEVREVLEAFTAGVNARFDELRGGQVPLANGINVIEPSAFEPWTPVDSLTIGRLQTWLLSYDADADIADTALLDDMRAVFNLDAGGLLARRAGIEQDVLRFAPPELATTIGGSGAIGEAKALRPEQQTPMATVPVPFSRPAALLDPLEGYRKAVEKGRAFLTGGGSFGSNNWAVAPERSATGYAMVASDPHLSLSSPAVFWPVSIHVAHTDDADADRDLDVAGLAFPGIPGIILGHNRHVAWGATVANHDVSDAYQETVVEGGVRFNGQTVPFEIIEERIGDGRGGEVVYAVQVVPHHGPIVPVIEGGQVVPAKAGDTAFSVRWTGLEPTHELRAVLGLWRAKNVDEARQALDDFGTGGQNWMLGDVEGNIAWTSHALVPYRSPGALAWDPQTYQGTIPGFVLPGDGTAEWEGFWDDDAVPWAKNPAQGYLSTANQDLVGTTLDNDPTNDLQADGTSGYLSSRYVNGYRQRRIVERIEGAAEPLTLDDMSSIQGDNTSALGRRLVPGLLLALDNAIAHATGDGVYADLTAVTSLPGWNTDQMRDIRTTLAVWGDQIEFSAEAGVSYDDNTPLPLDDGRGYAGRATLVFNVWLVRVLAYTFGDEFAELNRPRGSGRHYVRAFMHLVQSDPAATATYDADSGDSALWDDLNTPDVETRQERMVRAMVDALVWLGAKGGPDQWRWGFFHTVAFEPLSPTFGALRIPTMVDPVFQDGFPRPGDVAGVDASTYRHNYAVDDDPSFAYGSGPTQRFVIELRPDRPVVRNALPGGAVWDAESRFLSNQAERWRRNETLPVPFVEDEVIDAYLSRTVVRP